MSPVLSAYFQHEYFEQPVEGGLIRGRLVSEGDNLDWFKKERAEVLQYLEPQYKRPSSAASGAPEFIKQEKLPGDFRNFPSFERDIPFHIQAHMDVEICHKSCSTEATDLVQNVSLALAGNFNYDFTNFFRQAVRQLDAGFLIIRQARQKLSVMSMLVFAYQSSRLNEDWTYRKFLSPIDHDDDPGTAYGGVCGGII
ncbi:hypothetical protein BDZ45DRAFT_752735 [Acephala macrosclerotiorum]|nr:hypothetical protein BDZ45DRAFT_752735 [Acephala macrosclerotiorum]